MKNLTNEQRIVDLNNCKKGIYSLIDRSKYDLYNVTSPSGVTYKNIITVGFPGGCYVLPEEGDPFIIGSTEAHEGSYFWELIKTTGFED